MCSSDLRLMPPPGEARPDESAYRSIVTQLTSSLDRSAGTHPRPGRTDSIRRLTRTEYQNAIRDLLAIDHLPAELDFELLLPADNASSGFDNIADLLFMSPVVMERYLAAAQKIARLAVGDVRAPVMVNTHQLSEQQPQDERVDELSFGTRGGLAVRTYLPLDAEYTVDVETARPVREPFQVEVSVDGVQASVGTLLPRRSRTDPGADHATFRVPIAAGPHLVGIAGGESGYLVGEVAIFLHEARNPVEHAEHVLGDQHLPVALGRSADADGRAGDGPGHLDEIGRAHV